MNKTMLLDELMAQTVAESNINEEMENEIERANELSAQLKADWTKFVEESFPKEVLRIINKLPAMRKTVAYTMEYDRADEVMPIISVGDLHIAIRRDGRNRLVFIKNGIVIGFTIDLTEHRFGNLSWDTYPITFWRHLPHGISLRKSVDGMKENRKEIDLVYECNDMLIDFKRNIPQIYTEISRRNAEYVEQKRNQLASKPEPTNSEEPRKFRITIDVEEI